MIRNLTVTALAGALLTGCATQPTSTAAVDCNLPPATVSVFSTDRHDVYDVNAPYARVRQCADAGKLSVPGPANKVYLEASSTKTTRIYVRAAGT